MNSSEAFPKGRWVLPAAAGGALVAGLALGLTAPSYWTDSSAGSGTTGLARPAAAPQATDSALRARVEALGAAFEAQQTQLRQLVARLDALQGRALAAAEADGADDAPGEAAVSVTGNASAAAAPASSTQALMAQRRRFNSLSTAERQAALVAAGLGESEALELLTAVDDVDLQRLNLRYEAEREGWLGSSRFRDEMRALPRANEMIRERFGEPAYDRYLYASGGANRLQVQQVMVNSAASEAGLQPGDVVLRMDGQTVFSTRDLLGIARQGDAGELVPIEVKRGAANVVTYVPRGPLGMRTAGTRLEPGNNG